MPRTSKRGTALDHSPIRGLMPYARSAAAAGRSVFYLNIGQPDIPTPPQALAYLRSQSETIIKYGPSEGLTLLRQQVINYYRRFDAQLAMDEVYVTTGASEAIHLALFACCDPGDELIIPEPFYANYLGFSHISSVNIVPVTTCLEEQFGLPAPEAFEACITARSRAILLCNPGNPTGQLYNRKDLLTLLEVVKKHDLFLIVDEVYKEFCYDEDFTSVLSFAEYREHVIVLDSISKVFSSCGARVGFLISGNEEIQETVCKQAQLRLCPPHFGQQLAIACFEHGRGYIDEAIEEYRHRREVLYRALQQIEGLGCYRPAAAFYNMVSLPVADATDFCRWLLTDFEHHGKTLMLAPAEGFYFNRELGKQQVRVAYILKEQDLLAAVDCLKLALERYPVALTSAQRSS